MFTPTSQSDRHQRYFTMQTFHCQSLDIIAMALSRCIYPKLHPLAIVSGETTEEKLYQFTPRVWFYNLFFPSLLVMLD